MRLEATRKECGFSLIELLLVVGFLAITAAFAIPAFNGTMSAYRLRASADLVAGELDAARVMAISRGAVYRVQFYPDENAVQVLDPNDTVANAPRKKKFLEPGISIVAAPVIEFQPRGACTKTPSHQQVQLLNDKYVPASVDVSKTGKIRVVVGTYGNE